MSIDSRYLPFVKTATYAVMHFVVAVGVAFAITGNWLIAISIGLIEPAVQTVAYFFHEKAWARYLRPHSHRPHFRPVSQSH